MGPVAIAVSFSAGAAQSMIKIDTGDGNRDEQRIANQLLRAAAHSA
jgi:hypothetical protein